eukprot:3913227-Rhodomonas_salina.3
MLEKNDADEDESGLLCAECVDDRPGTPSAPELAGRGQTLLLLGDDGAGMWARDGGRRAGEVADGLRRWQEAL